MGTIGLKATGDGRATLEAVAFMKKGAGTTTGIGLGFQDEDIVTRLGEQTGGGESADASTDDNDAWGVG